MKKKIKATFVFLQYTTEMPKQKVLHAGRGEIIMIRMEQELAVKIEALEKKVDAVYASSEKMRKYFLWTLVVTAAVVILPLIGLIFVIPQFLSSYSGTLQ